MSDHGGPLRVAIFGGTFDPIHCAHLTVAREAAAQFALDRVLFVPAGHPPHKVELAASFEHRYHMVELACAGDPRFEPSRIEEGDQPSYSIDTILKVRSGLRSEDRLFFLIGADAFAELDSWHRAQEVIKLVEFIVVTRPGHEIKNIAGARVHRLETVALPVSSSEIRQKLAAGEEPQELPPEVLRYIRERRLYGT